MKTGTSPHLPIGTTASPLILVTAIIALYLWGPPTSHESASLLLVLNIVFTTLVSFFIAGLAGRSFLATGRPALLAICVGMIVWGASAFVAVIGEHVGNYNITIHNLGVAVSGLCHIAGALAAYRYGERSVRAADAWLCVGIAAGLGAVGAIWMSTLENWLPPFFIEGIGATSLRTSVLLASIGMYTAAAVLTGMRFRMSGWSFLLWYSIGLALISVGAVGLIMQPTHGSWLGWTARITQYVGGLYMLAGTVVTMRESGRWQFSLQQRLLRSEQAVRDQAEIIRNDNTSELIFMKDREGRLTYANAATLHLLGKTELASRSHDIDLFLIPVEHVVIAENDRRVMETGQTIEAEEAFTGADGRLRTFLSTKSPLRDPSGRVIGVIGVSRDITERVMAAAQLRGAKEAAEAASEALREADRRKDEFLATLAHELRNPLAPMRNALAILNRSTGSRETFERATSIMARQMDQMVRLVDDLLDVSRVSRGRLDLRLERVALAPIVRNAVETCQPLVDAARHDLRISHSSEPIYLNADPVRLAVDFHARLNQLFVEFPRYSHPLRRDRNRAESICCGRKSGSVAR